MFNDTVCYFKKILASYGSICLFLLGEMSDILVFVFIAVFFFCASSPSLNVTGLYEFKIPRFFFVKFWKLIGYKLELPL